MWVLGRVWGDVGAGESQLRVCLALCLRAAPLGIWAHWQRVLFVRDFEMSRGATESLSDLSGAAQLTGRPGFSQASGLWT